jgi:O-acetyl-ADP-ribose deacetylase (regulator of RNase III)
MNSQIRYDIGSGRALELLMGDITHETTDAIVNAANSGLLGGGGVDGAIHDAAGPELLEHCRKIREQRGTLPAGQAVSTPGAKLPSKYVIHTVGPIWQGGNANESQTLASAYRESLKLAHELGCASVSFPSISTGAYGYPVQQAALIAIREVVEFLRRTESPRLVRFVLFNEATYKAFAKAAEQLSSELQFQVSSEA